MSTSSGVGSQDSGEPHEFDTKDGEKVNIIYLDLILYIIEGYSYMYLVARCNFLIRAPTKVQLIRLKLRGRNGSMKRLKKS